MAFTVAAAATRIPPRSSLLSRILKHSRRLRNRFAKPPPPSHPRHTPQEWGELIREFEERSRPTSLPPPRTGPIENPEQYAMLPLVESAFMTALTTVLWWLGRMLRLDALLLLVYPLPNIYIAARHGLTYSNYTIASTILLVFSLVGPLYTILFVFNTGLLTMAYARALWYRWPWWGGLLAGGFAKMAGLVLQLWYVSGIMRTNSWTALTGQVTVMLKGICQLLGRVGVTLSPPGFHSVQIGIVVILAFHSFYHVFFTILSSTLMLRRMSEHEDMIRIPPEMPFVKRLLRRTRRP